MKKVVVCILTVLCALSVATAAEQKVTATQIVQREKGVCTDYNNGEFHSTEQTISLYDFTGDGRPETVVDASQFSCSTSVSMWGGTGGTYLWVVVDGVAHEFLAHQWKVVDMYGKNVLLLAVHPSRCDYTAGPCYQAYVWSKGAFRTTK